MSDELQFRVSTVKRCSEESAHWIAGEAAIVAAAMHTHAVDSSTDLRASVTGYARVAPCPPAHRRRDRAFAGRRTSHLERAAGTGSYEPADRARVCTKKSRNWF